MSFSDVFRYAIAFGGGAGFVALLWLVNREWHLMPDWGPRSRYIALLFYAMALTLGAIDRAVESDPATNYTTLGIATVAVLVLWWAVTMTYLEQHKEGNQMLH